MRELFFALGTLALLRHLSFSGWWDILIVIFVLIFDYAMKRKEIKAQAELEAWKMMAGKKK